MNIDPIHMKQIHVYVVYYNKTRRKRKQQPRSFFQFVSESQKKLNTDLLAYLSK